MKQYTTMSGSIYQVRDTADGKFEVRRLLLGEGHTKRPEQLAKRSADKLDTWRRAESIEVVGIGYRAIFSFSADGKDALVTSPIAEIATIVTMEDV